MLEIIKRFLSIFDGMLRNQQRSEDQATGARKAELKRRDELDAIKDRADEHREKTAGANADNVLDRL